MLRELIGFWKYGSNVLLTWNDLIPPDINECALYNGGCSHHCTNIPEGHYCSCVEGQTMSSDNRTCNGNTNFSKKNIYPFIGNRIRESWSVRQSRISILNIQENTRMKGSVNQPAEFIKSAH